MGFVELLVVAVLVVVLLKSLKYVFAFGIVMLGLVIAFFNGDFNERR